MRCCQQRTIWCPKGSSRGGEHMQFSPSRARPGTGRCNKYASAMKYSSRGTSKSADDGTTRVNSTACLHDPERNFATRPERLVATRPCCGGKSALSKASKAWDEKTPVISFCTSFFSPARVKSSAQNSSCSVPKRCRNSAGSTFSRRGKSFRIARTRSSRCAAAVAVGYSALS